MQKNCWMLTYIPLYKKIDVVLLTLREERKLRVFENMVLRRIFGPRRDEITRNGEDCITRS